MKLDGQNITKSDIRSLLSDPNSDERTRYMANIALYGPHGGARGQMFGCDGAGEQEAARAWCADKINELRETTP